MTTNENIGAALIIIAAGFFYFNYHLNEWLTVGMLILGLLTWVSVSTDKDVKNLQLELIKAKIAYYKSKTKER
jgi:hypothetical protein